MMPVLSEDLKNLELGDGIFEAVKFYVSGDVNDKVLELLKAGGAERMNYFSDYVTHLICGEDAGETDLTDANEVYDVPAVTAQWVFMCAKLRKLLSTRPYTFNASKLFSNLTFCFSRVDKDRNALWALVTYQGGVVQLNLDKNCTHLVTTLTDTEKYGRADSWGLITIVTPDWIVESYKGKCLADANLFHPKLILWPKVVKYESTTAITGFEPEQADLYEKVTEVAVPDSTQALLDKLKQRMPWNQPPASSEAPPPNVVAPSFTSAKLSPQDISQAALQQQQQRAFNQNNQQPQQKANQLMPASYSGSSSQQPINILPPTSQVPRSIVRHIPQSQPQQQQFGVSQQFAQAANLTSNQKLNRVLEQFQQRPSIQAHLNRFNQLNQQQNQFGQMQRGQVLQSQQQPSQQDGQMAQPPQQIGQQADIDQQIGQISQHLKQGGQLGQVGRLQLGQASQPMVQANQHFEQAQSTVQQLSQLAVSSRGGNQQMEQVGQVGQQLGQPVQNAQHLLQNAQQLRQLNQLSPAQQIAQLDQSGRQTPQLQLRQGQQNLIQQHPGLSPMAKPSTSIQQQLNHLSQQQQLISRQIQQQQLLKNQLGQQVLQNQQQQLLQSHQQMSQGQLMSNQTLLGQQQQQTPMSQQQQQQNHLGQQPNQHNQQQNTLGQQQQQQNQISQQQLMQSQQQQQQQQNQMKQQQLLLQNQPQQQQINPNQLGQRHNQLEQQLVQNQMGQQQLAQSQLMLNQQRRLGAANQLSQHLIGQSQLVQQSHMAQQLTQNQQAQQQIEQNQLNQQQQIRQNQQQLVQGQIIQTPLSQQQNQQISQGQLAQSPLGQQQLSLQQNKLLQNQFGDQQNASQQQQQFANSSPVVNQQQFGQQNQQQQHFAQAQQQTFGQGNQQQLLQNQQQGQFVQNQQIITQQIKTQQQQLGNAQQIVTQQHLINQKINVQQINAQPITGQQQHILINQQQQQQINPNQLQQQQFSQQSGQQPPGGQVVQSNLQPNQTAQQRPIGPLLWQQQQQQVNIRHPNVIQQQQQQGPRGQWSPNQQQGVRQFIHLDAQTHQQLQQMSPEQRALFVTKLQKQKQLQFLQSRVQQQRGGHILIRGGPVPPGLNPQQQMQWLQQQAKQGVVFQSNIQQANVPQGHVPPPQAATIQHAPGLSPIQQSVPFNEQNQQLQLQRQQFRIQQLQLQREQVQKAPVSALQPPATVQQANVVRPMAPTQAAVDANSAVAGTAAVVDPNVQQSPLVVNPKTKTALANMLSIRLQSGGSTMTDNIAEPSAAGTLRLMTAQHNAALNSSGRPQDLLGLQQRRIINRSNGDLIRPPPAPSAPPTVPQGEPPKLQYSPRNTVPLQHRPGTYYGHNPNLKLPPDLFLLGCVFVVVELERFLDESMPGWQKKIERHGGEVEKQYCNRVTHVICETQRHGVVMQALRDFKRCVTLYWLTDVISRKQVLPPWIALHLPTMYWDTSPASKHLISMSGYTGIERDRVKHMIKYIGGALTTYFTKHNTLLIVSKAEGPKYLHAKKWGIPVVNIQWLTDVMLGHFSALSQLEHIKYQQFSEPPNFSFDPLLVPNLMHAWKMPINISQESYEKVKRSASPVVLPQKAKKLKTEQVTDENDYQEPLMPTTPHRILFSMCADTAELKKIVRQLGGSLAMSHKDCTHLVMPQLMRSHKLLHCICLAAHIVPESWLRDSDAASKFLDESNYSLDTKEFNSEFKCDFGQTLATKNRNKLFEGKYFFLTPSVFPSRQLLAELIQSCGGIIERTRRTLSQIEATNINSPYSYVILTHVNDLHLVADLLKNKKDKVRIVCNVELIFSAILRQTFEVDPYAVKVL